MRRRPDWRQHLTMAFLLSSSCPANSIAAQHLSHRWEGNAVSAGDAGQRYRWSVERCGDRLRSEWRDSAGTLVAWDEVISQGASFGSYRMTQTGTSQRFTASRHNDKIVLEQGRPNGAKATRHIDARGETVLAGPMLVALIQERLTALRNGEALIRSYLVPEQAMVLRLIARRTHAAGNGNVSISIQAAVAHLTTSRQPDAQAVTACEF